MNNDTAQLIYNKFKDKEFNNHYTVKHLYAELLKATVPRKPKSSIPTKPSNKQKTRVRNKNQMVTNPRIP